MLTCPVLPQVYRHFQTLSQSDLLVLSYKVPCSYWCCAAIPPGPEHTFIISVVAIGADGTSCKCLFFSHLSHWWVCLVWVLSTALSDDRCWPFPCFVLLQLPHPKLDFPGSRSGKSFTPCLLLKIKPSLDASYEGFIWPVMSQVPLEWKKGGTDLTWGQFLRTHASRGHRSFPLGLSGLDVTCSVSYCLQRSVQVLLVYCDPLSLTLWSGMPNLAIADFTTSVCSVCSVCCCLILQCNVCLYTHICLWLSFAMVVQA